MNAMVRMIALQTLPVRIITDHMNVLVMRDIEEMERGVVSIIISIVHYMLCFLYSSKDRQPGEHLHLG